MANAQEVLAQLTNTWSSMLDKFYDSVADEYLQWMAKEYKMDIKSLREKAGPLKAKLLAKATESVTAVKTTKKPVTKAKIADESKYGSMPRKELVELCKSRNLPVKRKNQDMIDQLKKYDEDHEEKEESEDSENESEPKKAVQEESDNEPEPEKPGKEESEDSDTEPEPVKTQVKKIVSKKVKPTPPPKNELMEETLSDSEDED